MSRLFWRSCLRLSKTLRTLALACLLLFAPRLVEGREAAELAVLPFATVLVETGASDIDAGVEFQLADFRARTLLRSPLVREDGRSTGRLGHLTDSATFVGSLLYVHDGTGPDGPLSLHRLGLDFEFGVASYYFYPERSESKESLRRSAFSGGLQYLYYYGAYSSGFQCAPQARAKLSSSQKAGSTQYFASPNASDPNRVRSAVVDPPTREMSADVRFSIPVYPGWSAPVAIGPSAIVQTTGRSDLFASRTLRGELWTYIFASGEKEGASPSNLRIGIAPYYESQSGEGGDKVDYGVLLQLRVGTVLLEY